MATKDQQEAFKKIIEQIKKQGKKMLVVNRVKPDGEMIESIIGFLLQKQMKVNQLLAQTDETTLLLDRVTNNIAEIYSGIIET